MLLFCIIQSISSYPFKTYKRVHVSATLFTLLAIISCCAEAEWSSTVSNSSYYTDDVALFSVTRRLSLKDDPTQPVVDRPNQGDDFINEPSAELEWSRENFLGKSKMSLNAGGYIFVDRTPFSHGLYELQLSQAFLTDTKISLHYNVIPDLFLGKNTFKQGSGNDSEEDEKLTSHYWSLFLDQPLTNNLTIRLLGRYGLRNYNAPFQNRNTQFWTLGPHIEWLIKPGIELLVGYHYEPGTASYQKTVNVNDDISYVNQYASAELKIHILERLSSVFIVDFENNKFDTHNINDLHYGSSENVFQGEIELLYELERNTAIKLGWQHGSRKLTSDNQTIKNNNVWLGFEYKFPTL